ncbi:glycosyltransferase [Gordonia rhizosphera]|uniref:Putative glycosyltransferase n=1 Tax=Gordonia rhizosphera NBRC 16068 TaxID=1108045 RepID=K6WXT9_9ACTN|nr:glycosyltransferase [Gordonia rhizosphera]GAB91344.1 putative glycosyltransferase [Gordonia rhizosphera NBRC 16068]
MFFVVTPALNYGRFIADSIDSVRMQGVPARHHIQDACSTDITNEVVARHSWTGLTVVSENDNGQSDAVNRGMRHLGSERVISWLNADEYYLPFAFQRVQKIFEDNPEIDVVYGDSIHTDANGIPIRLVAQHRFSPFVLRTYGPYIQSASTFFRRELYEEGLLALDENLKQVMDLSLYIKLADHGARFRYCRTPLSAFRLHTGQVTVRNGREVEDLERAKIAGVRNSGTLRLAGRITHGTLKTLNAGILRERKFQRQYVQKPSKTSDVFGTGE